MLLEVLTVAPDYFDVVGSYNTRMRPSHPYGRPDPALAYRQWLKMSKALKRTGADVIRGPEPVAGLYDMAFACDPGLWIDDLFIAANFWAKPRQPEVEHFKQWFDARGVGIVELPAGAYFEGGDSVVVGESVIVGWGDIRTNIEGISALMRTLGSRGIKVVPIRRVTEEFYHLNSVLTHYPSADLIVFYAPAFEDGAFKKLRSELPSRTKIITIGEDEVTRRHPAFGGEYLYSYTLNSIEHNGKVIMPYCADSFRRILEGHGLETVVPELGSSEFERSGGSYRCLTMIHNITLK